MKIVLACALAMVLVGCGGGKDEVYGDDGSGGGSSGGGSGGGSAFPEAIVKGSCLTAGCHAGGAIVDLRTAAKFKASNSKARISGGSMPPPKSGPGKAFTADKKAALLSVFN